MICGSIFCRLKVILLGVSPLLLSTKFIKPSSITGLNGKVSLLTLFSSMLCYFIFVSYGLSSAQISILVGFDSALANLNILSSSSCVSLVTVAYSHLTSSSSLVTRSVYFFNCFVWSLVSYYISPTLFSDFLSYYCKSCMRFSYSSFTYGTFRSSVIFICSSFRASVVFIWAES